MPKALKIVRNESDESGEILIRRDGQPDLKIKNGRLILTVETQPVGKTGTVRWKVFRLYEPVDDWRPLFVPRNEERKAIVAEEGHSEKKGETTRFSAHVCTTGVGVWEAMDRMDELKPTLAELQWPVVEEV